MKIEIESKFNIGDIVYWMYKGNIVKCMIEEVLVNYNSSASCQNINYLICRWDEYYDEFNLTDTIVVEENELHSIEELKKLIDKLKKD